MGQLSDGLCIFFLDEFEAVLLGETCDASLFLLP